GGGKKKKKKKKKEIMNEGNKQCCYGEKYGRPEHFDEELATGINGELNHANVDTNDNIEEMQRRQMGDWIGNDGENEYKHEERDDGNDDNNDNNNSSDNIDDDNALNEQNQLETIVEEDGDDHKIHVKDISNSQTNHQNENNTNDNVDNTNTNAKNNNAANGTVEDQSPPFPDVVKPGAGYMPRVSASDAWNGEWATPENYQSIRPPRDYNKSKHILENISETSDKKSSVVCITIDLRMQQLLIDMGLRVMSLRSDRITKMKNHLTRGYENDEILTQQYIECGVCFHKYNDMRVDRVNCTASCGNSVLYIVKKYLKSNGRTRVYRRLLVSVFILYCDI
ncbi:Lipase, partial [Reticulomyxa filosa]